MTTPTDLLARLRAVLTAAEAMTPGPLRVVEGSNRHVLHRVIGVTGDGLSTFIVTDANHRAMPEADAAGFVALKNATTDLAALLALVEAPAPHVDRDDLALAMVAAGDNSGHADAIRSGRTPLPGWALAAASVAIARLTGQAPAPLTVGAAMPIGDALRSLAVLEWSDDNDWHQYDPVERGYRFRHRRALTWSPWRKSAAPKNVTVRLVPLTDADRDPNERGPL